jgi:phage terminase large subunit-like protein
VAAVGCLGSVADLERPVKFRERAWLAFDGSASGDSTALVGCTADGHLFVVGLWEHPVDDPRWRVPRDEVTSTIDEAFIKYDVAELACDPWGWRSEIEGWAKKHGRRKVIEFNTGATQRMAPATDRLFQAVVTRTCSHDGDPRFAAHVGNCVAKPTPLGDLVSKDKRGSPRKIDSAVAAIVAFERAAWHRAKRGSPRTKSRRAIVM